MNIELLEEIKNLLKQGKSLTDISNEITLSKSSITLMLRMEKILNKKFSSLESDYFALKQENDNLFNSVNFLILENEKFKNPFIRTPIFEPDCNFYKEQNEILDNKVFELEQEIKDLEFSLKKIPMFIKNIFNRI